MKHVMVVQNRHISGRMSIVFPRVFILLTLVNFREFPTALPSCDLKYQAVNYMPPGNIGDFD